MSELFQDDEYVINLKKAMIISLCLVIILFLLFPKFDFSHQDQGNVIFTTLNVEDIPRTLQGARKKPPPKPAVPIPTDDELVPDDITIEETELDFENYSEHIGSGFATGVPVVFQPRPIFEVIPEYSQELQKKGVEGVVKLHLHINRRGRVDEVIILGNSTGSKVCAEAAKKAALKGRYLPAKKSGKPTDIWIIRSYSFGIQK